MQRVYLRSDVNGFDLIVDRQYHSSLGWVDVCSTIIELTKLLRHGRGDVTLSIDGKPIEFSFIDAVEFVMQASSSLRWKGCDTQPELQPNAPPESHTSYHG